MARNFGAGLNTERTSIMVLPRLSTNAGYARTQQTGGSAGIHPAQKDVKRGLTPGPGKGGTAGNKAASVDAKTGQNHVTSSKQVG